MPNNDLAALFAKRFIQRRDVKAVQLPPSNRYPDGMYSPDRELKSPNRYEPLGFKMKHLNDHLDGQATYGHYLLDSDSKCRVFCFDIDLEKVGSYVTVPDLSDLDPFATPEETEAEIEELCVRSEAVNPRELWLDRTRSAAPARTWYKYQFKQLATRLCATIRELDIDCAAAYSGHKGVHVYGFTGELPAVEVREAALLVMDMMDEFEVNKGRNFFKHKNKDPFHGYPSMSIEVFPKQDTLDGKDLGNLIRLPLGTNLKNPKDPTFFLDLTTPLGDFSPHKDPIKLLESGDPFV